MIKNTKETLGKRNKIFMGKIILLLISSILAISILLFYTNYIERNVTKKGPISKNFWSNIFYANDNIGHPKIGSYADNTCYSMMNPGISLTYWGNTTLIWPTKVNINMAGFRDYDYSVDKPDGVFRIVMLGDSLVFGLGVNLEDTFPKVLEKMLNKDGKKFEVFNGGIPASNPYTQNLFFKHTLAQYDPDMILWFYSPDDYRCFDITTAYEMSSGSYLQDNAKKISMMWEALRNDPTMTVKTLQMHLITFLQSLSAELVTELLEICIKIPLLEFKQNIERKDSQFIYFILEDDPLYAWTIYEYIKKLNMPIVYDRAYINILQNHRILGKNDNHLTVDGHRLLGTWLYNYLKGNNLIEKKDQ